MSTNMACDLAATSGIHTGVDVIKMLLASSTVTQIASTLYKEDPVAFEKMQFIKYHSKLR